MGDTKCPQPGMGAPKGSNRQQGRERKSIGRNDEWKIPRLDSSHEYIHTAQQALRQTHWETHRAAANTDNSPSTSDSVTLTIKFRCVTKQSKSEGWLFKVLEKRKSYPLRILDLVKLIFQKWKKKIWDSKPNNSRGFMASWSTPQETQKLGLCIVE